MPKKKKTDYKLIWLVIFVIYISDSLIFSTNSNEVFIMLGRVLPVIFAFLFQLFTFRRKANYKDFFTYLACISVILSMLFSGRITNGYFYISIVACILFGHAFSRIYTLEEFADIFVKIMLCIAIVSIFCEIFKTTIMGITSIPTITNSNGWHYKFLLITNVTSLTSGLRNQGPFWEPGTYQVYLNVALFFSMFCVKDIKKSIIYSVIFVLTLVSTGSGIALIPAMLIILAYFINGNDIRKIQIAFIFIIFLFVLYYWGFLDAILLRTFDSTERSFQIRLYSIVGNLYAFIMNPILGASVEKGYEHRMYIINKYTNVAYYDNVNTFPALFAYLGGFVGTFYLLNLYKMIKSNIKKIIPTILIFIAVVISTSNENLTTSIFIATIIFLRNKQAIAVV